jgi:hypothetical protein
MILLVVFFMLATPVFLMQIQTVYQNLSQGSAEVVARELAGFMMISASAPEITITEELSEDHEYNITTFGREIVVNQSLADRTGLNGSIRMENEAREKIGVSIMNGDIFYNVSRVVISKTLEPHWNDPSRKMGVYIFEAFKE